MRILFFVQPGEYTRHIMRDFVTGFEKAGHQPMILELASLWNKYGAQPSNQKLLANASESLVRTVREQGIDATCAMEGLGLRSFAHTTGKGRHLTVFDVVKVPHLLFWFEAPQWADAGRYGPFFNTQLMNTKALVHVTDNAATAREMRDRLGMSNTVHTPWAADPEVFKPNRDVKSDYDLVVSCGKGNPDPTALAMKELENDNPDMTSIRRDLVSHIRPFIKEFASKSPKPAEIESFLDMMLETQISDRDTPVLDRMEKLAASDYKMGEALRTIGAVPQALIHTLRIVRNIEISERAFIVSWLARRFRTLVIGDHNLQKWDLRADQEKSVRHPEMSRALARGKVVVHTARWQDDASLGTRPFEIAQSGLAGVVQRRRGIEHCFEHGREMSFFDSPADAAKEIKALLADDKLRTSIGEAARARAERDHTWKNRAIVLAEGIEAAKKRLA